MKIHKGTRPAPRRVMVYGQHGVGKNTFANWSPNPIFLNLEDGCNDINCSSTDVLKTAGDVAAALSWLITEPHDYQTVVLDSADWFDSMVMKHAATKFGKETYEEIEFGRGRGQVISQWQWILGSLDTLRSQKKMNAILLCHSRIEKFDSPDSASYDRYVPDLHKITFGLVQEWVDEVLFLRFRTFTTEQKESFGSKKTIAVGSGERYIQTTETASASAKNRLQLPAELPLTGTSADWQAYQAYWAKAKPEPTTAPSGKPQSAGNIAGAVVEGSSKTVA